MIFLYGRTSRMSTEALLPTHRCNARECSRPVRGTPQRDSASSGEPFRHPIPLVRQVRDRAASQSVSRHYLRPFVSPFRYPYIAEPTTRNQRVRRVSTLVFALARRLVCPNRFLGLSLKGPIRVVAPLPDRDVIWMVRQKLRRKQERVDLERSH